MDFLHIRQILPELPVIVRLRAGYLAVYRPPQCPEFVKDNGHTTMQSVLSACDIGRNNHIENERKRNSELFVSEFE